MHRSLQQLADSIELNKEYLEINALQKELYLQNQQRMQKQPIVIDEDQPDPSPPSPPKPPIEEERPLPFPTGTFCLNALTQYPKDDRQAHIMPFINLLYENPHIDVKTQKPTKTLQAALMTCYGFEDELLEPIVKANVELTIVNDNDNADKKTEIIEKYKGYPNWLIIKPAKHNSNSFGGSFHPKIWMLKFPTFLRIIIGSQNLHVADWTVWSQAMWVQDFKPGNAQLDDNSSEFKTLLKEFMIDILPTNYNFQDLLKIKYDDYEFSNINIRLITSLPGRYLGNSYYKHGIMRLQSVINQEQLRNKYQPKAVKCTYQTTSIGTLDYHYIDLIKQSCLGKTYTKTMEGQKTLTQAMKQQIPENEQEKESQFAIIYPTMDYIINKTHGGVEFASPLWLQKKQLDNPKFPRQLFHRFEGSEHYYWHEGTIPHLKVLLITNLDSEINDESSIYMGSHNLSLAAWGRLEKNGTQLFIANTELGVLYPPGKGTAEIKKQIVSQLSFKFPPQKYEKEDRPWVAENYYEELAKQR